ncbi:MAG: hypothetical protein IJH84_28960 [Saccharopolyspora sp.]|uniref:hypothetical protein n=1 Tax=Saccharopolyspora sp. TaxID=33915 RepID=UPI0025E1ECE7|nr:hypothetical protein [Saccharopolyspora sp.]MBQ6645028.1 hypothetical protein [Saccharopolyspora sp.]
MYGAFGGAGPSVAGTRYVVVLGSVVVEVGPGMSEVGAGVREVGRETVGSGEVASGPVVVRPDVVGGGAGDGAGPSVRLDVPVLGGLVGGALVAYSVVRYFLGY